VFFRVQKTSKNAVFCHFLALFRQFPAGPPPDPEFPPGGPEITPHFRYLNNPPIRDAQTVDPLLILDPLFSGICSRGGRFFAKFPKFPGPIPTPPPNQGDSPPFSEKTPIFYTFLAENANMHLPLLSKKRLEIHELSAQREIASQFADVRGLLAARFARHRFAMLWVDLRQRKYIVHMKETFSIALERELFSCPAGRGEPYLRICKQITPIWAVRIEGWIKMHSGTGGSSKRNRYAI